MTGVIDAHVHPPVDGFLDGPLAPYREALGVFLGAPIVSETPEEIAARYRAIGGRAVLLGWDAESSTGLRPFGSNDVAAVVAAAPDVFVGFGAVDPRKGSGAVADVHQTARLGLKGLALHPAAQGLAPSDRVAFPVWETAQEHDLTCLIHTGFTRLGAGMSGGGGIDLSPARPLHVDAVAAAFPGLTIVLAHTGALWLDEAVAVAMHKANVWLDLSGQRPERLSRSVLELLQEGLVDRVLFGSDYPFSEPDVVIGAWNRLGLPGPFLQALLHDNAARLLGLDPVA